MAANDTITPEAAALAARVVGLRCGSIEVLAVRCSFDVDVVGRWALFVDLTVTNPPDGEPTWDLDDVLDLRRRVGAIATEVYDPEGWFVWVHAAHPAPKDRAEDEPDYYS